jgi:hypothetical protein
MCVGVREGCECVCVCVCVCVCCMRESVGVCAVVKADKEKLCVGV